MRNKKLSVNNTYMPIPKSQWKTNREGTLKRGLKGDYVETGTDINVPYYLSDALRPFYDKKVKIEAGNKKITIEIITD